MNGTSWNCKVSVWQRTLSFCQIRGLQNGKIFLPNNLFCKTACWRKSFKFKSTKGLYLVEVPIKYLLLFGVLFIFLPQPPQWEYLQMFVIKSGCPVKILLWCELQLYFQRTNNHHKGQWKNRRLMSKTYK